MALTVDEGTKKETMERIAEAGFPIGYANIMRLMVDCHGNYSGEMRRYYSEEKRRENEYATPGLIGYGGQISKKDMDSIFKIIYPYIELDINKTALLDDMQKEINSIEDTDKKIIEKKKAEIIKKYTDKIEALKKELNL